jgi:hypothetical protein
MCMCFTKRPSSIVRHGGTKEEGCFTCPSAGGQPNRGGYQGQRGGFQGNLGEFAQHRFQALGTSDNAAQNYGTA